MKFQVTKIEFDFDNSCPYCGGDCYNDHDNACDGFLGDIDHLVQQQQQTVDETISQIWEVDDEEHLVDKISDETGWCIKSIDYNVFIPGILSWTSNLVEMWQLHKWHTDLDETHNLD